MRLLRLCVPVLAVASIKTLVDIAQCSLLTFLEASGEEFSSAKTVLALDALVSGTEMLRLHCRHDAQHVHGCE